MESLDDFYFALLNYQLTCGITSKFNKEKWAEAAERLRLATADEKLIKEAITILKEFKEINMDNLELICKLTRSIKNEQNSRVEVENAIADCKLYLEK